MGILNVSGWLLLMAVPFVVTGLLLGFDNNHLFWRELAVACIFIARNNRRAIIARSLTNQNRRTRH